MIRSGYKGEVATVQRMLSPVGKALWYVESHFEQDLSLDEIADIAGVSRYYMSRAFGMATGLPITRYVRGRRLTEAARRLAGGAPDILTVALDSGYNSHEAFSRAFREHFGMTPEAVRSQGHLDNLELVEAIKMEEGLTQLEAPRFENGRALNLAGLSERYNSATSSGIPAQWQRFGPWIGNIPGQLGAKAYGVVGNTDDEGSMEYLCGVEVAPDTSVPKPLIQMRIEPQKYAVFLHRDHVSKIRSTWHTIFNRWLPSSGYEAVRAPELEVYGEQFDPRTGTGGLEIWIPVKPAA